MLITSSVHRASSSFLTPLMERLNDNQHKQSVKMSTVLIEKAYWQ